MASQDVEKVLALARQQAQVVTRAQALGLGLSSSTQHRLVGMGQWQRLAHGVLLTHSGQPGFDSLCWAGLLLGGEGSLVAGRAAAHLWGLDEAPEVVEVLLPHGRRRADQGCWHFRQVVTMPPGRRTPARVEVEDTVLDLCAEDPSRAEAMMTEACARHTTRRRLRRALAARPRFPHRLEMLELLAEDERGVDSRLERIYLRDVARAHGLPEAVRQVRGGGTVRDMVYELGLVVELDGRRGHEGSGAFRDMGRDNRNTALGLLSLRYGFGDCRHRPCVVAAEVGAVLQRLGWRGSPTSCSRCS